MNLPVVNNFINGQLRPARSTFTCLNYFKNEPEIEGPDSEVIDVVQAIAGAQSAYSEWKNSSLEDRQTLITKLTRVLNDNQASLIEATAQDMCLPRTFVQEADHAMAVSGLEALFKELNQTWLSSSSQPSHSSRLSHSSIGPVAFVLSYQFPLRHFVKLVVPTLLAGNSAVVKLSSQSVRFQKVFIDLLISLDLPKGLVQVLNGTKKDFKDFLIAHPGAKAICLVGTHDTVTYAYKHMQNSFANTYKKQKFLGGAKNISVVFSDFNEDLGKRVLKTFLLGQGQLHWNSTRLFVLEKSASMWREFIANQIQQLKPSEGIDDTSWWTPLIRAREKEKYSSMIDLAKSDQAKLITTKAQHGAHFVQPIFTEDMSNCSTLQQDQVGAPLFILSSVKYPFDIPKYANVSYYGDTAHMWVDPGKGEKVISELLVSNIVLNKWSIEIQDLLPGRKQSSFGVTDHHIFGSFHSQPKSIF